MISATPPILVDPCGVFLILPKGMYISKPTSSTRGHEGVWMSCGADTSLYNKAAVRPAQSSVSHAQRWRLSSTADSNYAVIPNACKRLEADPQHAYRINAPFQIFAMWQAFSWISRLQRFISLLNQYLEWWFDFICMLKSSLLAFTRIQYDCIIRIGCQEKELYCTWETENCTSTTTLLYEQIIIQGSVRHIS